METREYYGEQYPLLGYGCMRFYRRGGTVIQSEAEPLIDLAMANGVNYFDCAHIYVGSEAFLGAALSKYPRASWHIATKLHVASFKEIDEVKRVFEGQLERLKTDYVDNYLLHGIKGHNWQKLEKAYDLLASFKKEGAIKHLGFSFHDTPALLKKVVNSHEWDFAQIQLNYLDWRLQNAEGQYQILREAGLPIFVMEGLRGGVLASNVELAFRWIAQFPEVVTILSGMVNETQIKQNVEIFSHIAPLSQHEAAQIEKLREDLLASGRVPCTACRYCEVCPKNIDIPTSIAAWNEYKSGKNLNNGRNAKSDFIARLNYVSSFRLPHRCVKCGKCKEVCPQHIDIPAVLEEIVNERNALLKK